MAPERLGKYEVLRKIATGGMSEVWLCRLVGEEGFEKKVAVKVIHPRHSDDRRFREFFAREARITASLSHPNLVQVFDFGRHGESCYLAMEYVPGWNLAQAAAQARLRATPVPLPVWRHWVEGILAGIGYLHSRNVVHRDVSPSNILLSKAGAVKIADFGIARGARHCAVAGGGHEGKFSYMSPEQARGEEETFSSDLFAVAVVAAELFLPGRLFDGTSSGEILDRVRHFDPGHLPEDALPRPVDGLLRKALSGRKEDRYADADAFADALRAAVPASAGRGDLLKYWDLLFPRSDTGDEATVVIDAPVTGGRPEVVRERREGYGSSKKRRIMLISASALAAFSIGGIVVWNGMRSAERRELRVVPEGSGSAVPPPSKAGGESGRDVRGTDPAGAVPAVAAARVGPDADRGAGTSLLTPRDAPGAPMRSGPDRRPGDAIPDVRRGVLLDTDPPGVAVSIDEEIPLGKTPLRIDVSPWNGRTITFRKEGYVKRAIRAESLSGLADFRMEMDRQTGTVETVQAIPWAKVYEGDRYLGDTPFGPLTLSTGEHRLRFVNEPLGIEKEERVVILPGGNPKIIVYLITK